MINKVDIIIRHSVELPFLIQNFRKKKIKKLDNKKSTC